MIVVDRRIINSTPAEGLSLRRVSSVGDDVVTESAEVTVGTDEPEVSQKKRGRKKKEGV